jgi:hypothetical protein
MNEELKPVKTVKGVPMFSGNAMNNLITKELNQENGRYLTRGAKNMSIDLNNAQAIVDESTKHLHTSINKLNDVQQQLSEQAKKVSGSVRKAADELSQGLIKVEKQANFDRLERYVSLLERAAAAMETLAELEKSGRLDKIAGALK